MHDAVRRSFFSKFRDLVVRLNQIPASDDIKAVNEVECNFVDAEHKSLCIIFLMHHLFREKPKN